jgi:hypothetical protein
VHLCGAFGVANAENKGVLTENTSEVHRWAIWGAEPHGASLLRFWYLECWEQGVLAENACDPGTSWGHGLLRWTSVALLVS